MRLPNRMVEPHSVDGIHPAIGAINYIQPDSAAAHFKHYPGMVSHGSGSPPGGRALHLGNCECGSGEMLMTVSEYRNLCHSRRSSDAELSPEVKESDIGRLVDWRGSTHPLVCIHAAGVMDQDSDSTIEINQLSKENKKCACWEDSDPVESSILEDSLLIFAAAPSVYGFDPPSHSYISNELVEFEESLDAKGQFEFQDRKIPYAVFEYEPAGDAFNQGQAWRHIPLKAGSSTKLDERQPHLLIMGKEEAAEYLPGPGQDLRKPLRWMLRRFNGERWLRILTGRFGEGKDVIPVLFSPKGASPDRKIALGFSHFESLLDQADVTAVWSGSSNQTRSLRTKDQLDCSFFHDREKRNHVSHDNPLKCNEAFWLQVTYSHGFNKFLQSGDSLRVSIYELSGSLVEAEAEFNIDEDETSQLWIRRKDGLKPGMYQFLVRAFSGDTYHGRGRSYLRIAEGA